MDGVARFGSMWIPSLMQELSLLLLDFSLSLMAVFIVNNPDQENM